MSNRHQLPSKEDRSPFHQEYNVPPIDHVDPRLLDLDYANADNINESPLRQKAGSVSRTPNVRNGEEHQSPPNYNSNVASLQIGQHATARGPLRHQSHSNYETRMPAPMYSPASGDVPLELLSVLGHQQIQAGVGFAGQPHRFDIDQDSPHGVGEPSSNNDFFRGSLHTTPVQITQYPHPSTAQRRWCPPGLTGLTPTPRPPERFDSLRPRQPSGPLHTANHQRPFMPTSGPQQSLHLDQDPQFDPYNFHGSSMQSPVVAPTFHSGQQRPWSESSPISPQAVPKRASKQASRTSRATAVASVNCPEPGPKRCKRKGKIGPDNPTGLCTRHLDKFQRNYAATPNFAFPGGVNSYREAHDHVYQLLRPLYLDGDDVPQPYDLGAEDRYVNEFVIAANIPYSGEGDYPNFHARQQKVFSGKRYKNKEVNVRMRLLYRTVMTFHHGGRTVYPEGGDNAGYGRPDRTLIFSDRVGKIIEVMKLDKRVVMDVVEGRGVGALVGSPEKFERRKTQNMDSNERKQKKQQLGDRVQAKRKAKGRATEDSDLDSDEFSDADGGTDEEDASATPAPGIPTPASLGVPVDMGDTPAAESPPLAQAAGDKRKRQTRSSTLAVPKSKRAKSWKASNGASSDQEAAPIAAMQAPNAAVGHADAEGSISTAVSKTESLD